MRRFRFVPALLLLSACASPQQHTPRNPELDTGQPALHAVVETRLRGLMDQMDSIFQERFMTEPERDRERRKEALKIAEAAGSLGKTVDAILLQMPELHLPEHEQTIFRALAVKLREQAAELQRQAQQNQIDIIPQSLDQLAATCTSCHTLFRKLEK